VQREKFGHVQIPFKRIHVELTNVCDFNCVFCPKSLMTRRYGYMDEGLARRIITDIRTYGLAEKITFHVMGEPTLHPKFFSLLDHAASEGMPVGLTTNGGGLGGRIGAGLLDRPLHQVDVSLQTPDEISFALRKAKNLTFDRFLNGIVAFFSAYRERHPQTIFKFRFLNTTIPVKTIEKKNGPVRVISSTRDLRTVLGEWVKRIYAAVGEPSEKWGPALARVNRLVSYKWNVVEILPRVFFETYLLADWGHAFNDGAVKPAWAGFCDGMRDHFAILHNGDVTLCCVDFNGKTVIGNLKEVSIKDVLSSEILAQIMRGFERYRLVHPYCRHCLGSKNTISWLTKPLATIAGLHVLRPFFYHQIRLFD
jgi:MoaA/NifB/PqqE/SkfB family radical SAM enzyme